MQFNGLKNFIIPTIIAMVQFIASLFFKYDALVFNYADANPKIVILSKIALFFVLIALWNLGFYIYREIKNGNDFFKRILKISGIYFLIIMGILILVWPGLWAWDDLWTLNQAAEFKLNPWQHIFSSLEMMTLFQVLPFLGGFLIIRNAIISLIVGFVITKFETTFSVYLKNRLLDIFIKLFPFLLFPVLRYQLSGYRIGIYIYIEAAMLIMLICSIKDKKEWGNLYFGLFSLFSVCAVTLRTEGLIYLPFILLLIILMKHTGSNLKRIICSVLIIAGVSLINISQNYFIKVNGLYKNYQVLSTLRPCVALLRTIDRNKYQKEIDDIWKVINLDEIDGNPDKNGEDLFFENNFVMAIYSESEYKNYLKAFFKISIENPKEVLKERNQLLLDSNGFNGIKKIQDNVKIKSIFSHNQNINKIVPYYDYLGDINILNKPINRSFHSKISTVITVDNNEVLHKIVWNCIYPSIIILLAFIYSLIKRKWLVALILSSIILKFIIVYLTVPSNWFMYYVSFYLIGYIILIYTILYLFRDKRSIKNE